MGAECLQDFYLALMIFFPTLLKCPKITGADSIFFKNAGADKICR